MTGDDGDRQGWMIEALRLAPLGPRVRWGRILTWFLRLMAVLWMMMGLLAWADILGVIPSPVPFEDRSLGAQAASTYFAVLNLVAAVGLWLTSTWGGIMWLLALMSHLILAIFLPGAVASGALTVVLFTLLAALYLVFSWLAAHDQP
ncbi:DUF6163 family protein [Camelimonas abortus]|uniref:DUF6163 family protein n=1 Tax=Camelimonas abortus TaxID=1017184 RepID=A0ABV7LBX8_9HYPH